MTMTVRLDATARSALRRALKAHDGWNEYRRANNVDIASATKDELLIAAAALGIDLATITGQDAEPMNEYNPKPRTVNPETVTELERRFRFVSEALDAEKREKARSILATANTKQDGWMTERQFGAVNSIVREAEGKKRAQDANEQDQMSGGWTPALAPAATDNDDDDEEDEAAVIARAVSAALAGRKAAKFDEGRVIELIQQHAGKPSHVTIDLRTPHGIEPHGEALMHYRFPLLLAAVSAGVNVMLVGPAGSGKTTAAEKVAELLGLDFYFTGAIDSPYKLSGFIDAQGRIVHTSFRRAFEHGGVFLFDEQDASIAGAVLAFNAALANGHCDFPDGIVKRHPNFRALAACNTFGRGADRQYVGRLQQDAAALDRYASLVWDYDPALEAAMIDAPRPDNAPQPVKIERIEDQTAARREAHRWLAHVVKVRSNVEREKVRHVVSPRATMTGARLLAAGWPWVEVEEACLWKGIDADTRKKIAA